jgi:malonyl-CoA/methylmalonyl-CoA synthetase
VNPESSNLYTVFADCFPEDRSADLLTTEVGQSYSYADAEKFSAQVANCLIALGLRRGDRVTVQVEKSPQLLFLYLGVLRAGLVFHPLNTAYTREELAYFLQDAAPSLVVCDPIREALFGELCDRSGGAKLMTLDAAGGGSLWEVVPGFSEEFDTAHNEPGDMAALLYSSGTTGRPKGIMLSHENLGNNASVLREYWGFTRDDTLLHALPIFHVHGLFVAIGCVLMSGSRMRWLPAFDVTSVIEALPQCTVMMGVPTYYTRLLAEPAFGPGDCERVRLFISGSAPLLADTFDEFRQRTGKTILERYGMSETGMLTSNPLEGERRAGTVGFPLPGVDVRVVGPDGGELGVGEVGAIQVRGANVFSGYWNLPDKTAEDFTEDGFFNTGDQGRFDGDGYLAIVGRAKDMIITGGLNVYPKEIELLIDDIPGVRESAVVGLPHPDFGEAVTAVVVPEPGAALDPAEITAYVKARAANFKVPKAVHIVDSLPRNTMGKVQKNLLREQLG